MNCGYGTEPALGGEIQDDLYRRLTGLEPGLTGFWRFDEANGSQVFDATGNGGTGILQGGAKMAPSDAPLGQDQGLNRNSFGIEGGISFRAWLPCCTTNRPN